MQADKLTKNVEREVINHSLLRHVQPCQCSSYSLLKAPYLTPKGIMLHCAVTTQ